MRLWQLAYCCRLYEQLTGSDRDLRALRSNIGDAPDLTRDADRRRILTWLNAWGARRSIKGFSEASTSLQLWAEEWLKRPGFHGDFLPWKWRKDHGNQPPLIEALPA